LEFVVPSWSEGFESFTENSGMIFETRNKSTAVDVVELLLEDPLIFCIVNFKTAVGGDALSLAHWQKIVRMYSQFWLNCT